jgi:pimeloyl-ACP methyl ester carboxylesterase
MSPLLVIVVVVAGLLVAAACYESFATRRDQTRFPPTGQMVDAGGHRLQLLTMGEGTPTVILDAGMVSFSSNWAWVQPEVAKATRVVAYDRAGLGWSDPGPPPRDAERSARELHVALGNAGMNGPYVLVGHSYGGLVMRAFADLYPDEAAGLVLVDASHPDQWANIPASRNGQTNATGQKVACWLARVGLFRVWTTEAETLAAGLPPRQYAEIKAFCMTPAALSVSSNALAVWDSMTRPQINQAKKLGDMPLVVLSVTEQALYAEVLTRLQNELPALSSNSQQITVQGATHENLVSRQEHAQVVTDAILRVVEAARTGKPLAAH